MIATLLALATMAAASAAAWPVLPARIPRHFDFGGGVDRWVARTPEAWWSLPMMTAATVGFLFAMAWALPRSAEGVNLPDKQRLLALPRHQQQAALEPLAAALCWAAFVIVLVMGAVQGARFATATGGPGKVLLIVAGTLLVALPFPFLFALGRVQEAIARFSREQPPPPAR
jgi:uncharacterized membrane protein